MGGKVVEAVDCDRQVDVSALVQDLDPEPPQGLETGHLVLKRPGDTNRVTARTSAKAAKAASWRGDAA